MRHARIAGTRLPGAALALLALTLTPAPSAAATLPAGFTEAAVVPTGSLSNPTAMQFAPDGRLFVCQQTGALRVIKNGSVLATPFVTLTVDPNGERGLLGVAFDPNFAVNQYVYVYYTVPAGGGVVTHNRVSRFTANGDVAVAGSEVVIMDLDPLSSATNHNGGAIAFGTDGKLYIAVGDNANGANAQSMSTRFGKMLRVNTDGTIPTDNPFYGTASGSNRAIWALGLRNPFTFALNPGGPFPTMLINDVGQSAWEEVNDGIAGANYGWPTIEGPIPNPNPLPGSTGPRTYYGHGSSATTGCAITGGAFYNPPSPTFPAGYLNTYLFADYCSGWIRRLDPASGTVTGFATGISAPVDLKTGVDGYLYYLARGAGTVFRVQYGDVAPGITTHPANRSVSPGQAATFTVVATGTAPLAYQWQRGGVNIQGATSASYTLTNPQLADSGARFRVSVSNSAGNLFSNEAVLTVTTNQAPVATITAPSVSLRYTGGMTVAFAGTGTDPEDGNRPASALSWRVDFHHDTHTHPFLPQTSGITGGSFLVPTSGETSANVWYRIYLTVSDSGGRSTTVQRDVLPRVARLTLDTSPAGLALRLDGQPLTAPLAFDSVVGVQRTLEAPAQTAAGVSYAFGGWSDGGAPARAILTPSVDTTFTATYRVTAASAMPNAPSGLTATVNGATVRLAWTRSAGAQRYRVEAGSASGLANLANTDVGDVASVQTVVPPGVYYVRVRGVNVVGASAPSNQITVTVSSAMSCAAPPPAPLNFTAQTGGVLAALSWAASAGATSYAVDAGLSSGAANYTANAGNVTTFQTMAAPGKYFARVRALNACGSSAPSTEVPVTLACGPGAVVPGNLAVTNAGGVATFTWMPPLGATSYRVRVGTAAGASDVADIDVGNATSLAVPLAGVAPRTYYVRVVAVSACGVGAASNEVTVTVP